MTYLIELIGGPLDGETYSLAEALQVVRFASVNTEAMWAGEAVNPAAADVKTIEYFRTKTIRNGRTLYLFKAS